MRIKKVGISTKLISPWSPPFKVIKKISPVIYQVESQGWNQSKIILQRSISYLKPGKGKTIYTGTIRNYSSQDFNQIHEFDSPDFDIDEDEVED